MAKTLNSAIEVAKETAYATASMGLVVAASMNSQARFTPVYKSNGVSGSSAEYFLQRPIRIQGQEVATPNAKTTTNDLAVLDSFQTSTEKQSQQ